MTTQPHLADLQMHEPTTTLSGWRLHFARLAWLVTTSLVLILLVLIARERPSTLWLEPYMEDSYQLLAPLVTFRQYAGYVIFLRYLVAGVFVFIAMVVYWRKSKDLLALLTSVTLVFLPYLAFYNTTLYELDYPYPSPWKELLPFAESLVMSIGLYSLVRLLFIFPDGRFVPRRLEKPIQWLFNLLVFGFIIIAPWQSLFTGRIVSFLNNYGWVFFSIGFATLMLLGIAGQVYRYLRHSTPVQKQQTKWIVFSMLVNLGFGGLGAFGLGNSLRFGSAAIFGLVMIHAGPVVVLLLPLSLALSVLRYRLWDIDVIIRRTLVYSALTGALSMLYFGGVAISQALLTADRGPQAASSGAVSSQPSAAVIVMTTLAIAALFSPLRRRIQNLIDRRFYRQKYDAENALAVFATSARSSTDLEDLSEKLVSVVCVTLHPNSLNLWLKSTIRNINQEKN